jgi:hypothetical protein
VAEVAPLTVSATVTVGLGSTDTKSTSPSLSGEDLEGGGAYNNKKIQIKNLSFKKYKKNIKIYI